MAAFGRRQLRACSAEASWLTSTEAVRAGTRAASVEHFARSYCWLMACRPARGGDTFVQRADRMYTSSGSTFMFLM